MTVEQEYQRQVELAEWIDDNFKIELPADEKSLIAIGCFDITIEHHAAICVLIKAEFTPHCLRCYVPFLRAVLGDCLLITVQQTKKLTCSKKTH